MSEWFQLFVTAATNAAIYALIALSLVLVYRASGIINFGVGYMATFAGIYFANHSGKGNVTSLVMTLLAGAAIGIITYLVAVFVGERRQASHAALAISCLGFGLVLDYFAGHFWAKQGFTTTPLWAGRFKVLDVTVTNQRLFTVIAAVVCFIVVFILLERTMVGWSLEAVAFRRSTASLYGVSVTLTLVLVWMLAGVLAAGAGALLTPVASISRPVALQLAVKGFASAVVGGLGSVHGALAGAAAVAGAEALFIRYVSTTYASAFSFLLLFVVLAIRPQGIFGQQRQVQRT